MRRPLLMPRLLLLVTTTLSFAASELAATVHRFDGGRWFDGERFVSRTVWSVDGVFRLAWDGAVDRVVDLHGSFVIPPFADAHHHAFGNAHAAAADRATFLSDGVFYVKNPNNVASFTAAVRSQVNRPDGVDVIYANGGFTSGGGHPSQIYASLAERLGKPAAEMEGDAYVVIETEADIDRVWPRFAATDPDFVKIYLERSEEHESRRGKPEFVGRRGLDPRLVAPLVARARKEGLPVSAHVASAADFRVAVAAGVDEITHLPLERLTADDAKAAAARNVRVVTTTISHRPTDGVADLHDVHRHNLRLLRAAGVSIVLGTDDSRTVVAEAENLHRLGVFEPPDLLRIWTRDTARAIFPHRKIGVLEEGAEASFLALSGDPLEDLSAVRRIALRVKQGRVLEVERPKQSLAEELVPILREKGPGAVVAEFDRLRSSARRDEAGAQVLNALGYALLRHGNVEGALVLFRANVERFPGSSNVHDSLGEALVAAGEVASAIASYEKALELDPGNANALKMLEKLRERAAP